MKPIAAAFAIVLLLYSQGYAQDSKTNTGGFGADFTTFTQDAIHITPELESLTNKKYKSHPEYGVLPFNAPCKDCIELLQKRDESHRYFVKNGSKGKDFYEQTSYGNMSYEEEGVLRTIDPRLKPADQEGVFVAKHQLFPVTINMPEKFTSILNAGKELQVNRNITIFIERPDGSVTSLGEPDWKDYTAGDNGVLIHNFYQGIDLELHVGSGNVESSYRLNRPLTGTHGIADGWLVIRDNMKMAEGLAYDYTHSEKMDNNFYEGSLYLNNQNGAPCFYIGSPVAQDENSDDDNRINLDYRVTDSGIYDIYIPLTWMNDPKRSYPLVIDPFITATSTLPATSITGSGYSATCNTNGCAYNLDATVPPACTITDVTTTFWYLAAGTCFLSQGAWDLTCGACHFPGTAPQVVSCNFNLNGVCQKTNLSCFSDIQACLPPPGCNLTLPFTLYFYRCVSPGGACGTPSCISADVITPTPWSITVTGKAVDITTQPESMCPGANVNLSANATCELAPFTYTWYPGNIVGNPVNVSPAATTTYTVTINNCNGQDSAQATSMVTVFSNDNPGFTIHPNPACAGAQVALAGLAPPATSYDWILTGGTPGNINNQRDVNVTYASAGNYNIVLQWTSPSSSCIFNDTLPITVIPPATLTTPDDTIICAGQSVTLCASASGGSGVYTYSWNSGLGTGNCLSVTPPATGPDVYTVSLHDACESNAVTGQVTVTVVPAPVANFSYSPLEISMQSPVHFANQSTGYLAPCLWDFGDGTMDSLDQDPSHTYDKPGTYIVTLSVRNAGACSSSITYTLEVTDDYFFYIPNSFTPNGDGINDYFAPQGTDAANISPLLYTMIIYNRWGEKIFETDNSSLSWGGQDNNSGKMAECGVYVYRIQFLDTRYSNKTIVGAVTLVR